MMQEYVRRHAGQADSSPRLRESRQCGSAAPFGPERCEPSGQGGGPAGKFEQTA